MTLDGRVLHRLSDGLAELYLPGGGDFPGRVIRLVSGLVAADERGLLLVVDGFAASIVRRETILAVRASTRAETRDHVRPGGEVGVSQPKPPQQIQWVLLKARGE